MTKKAIWFGMFVGSTIGGCAPLLWHASAFSLWGIVLGTVGGLVGIWVGYRTTR